MEKFKKYIRVVFKLLFVILIMFLGFVTLFLGTKNGTNFAYLIISLILLVFSLMFVTFLFENPQRYNLKENKKIDEMNLDNKILNDLRVIVRKNFKKINKNKSLYQKIFILVILGTIPVLVISYLAVYVDPEITIKIFLIYVAVFIMSLGRYLINVNQKRREVILKSIFEIINSKLKYNPNGSDEISEIYSKVNFKDCDIKKITNTDYLYGTFNNIDLKLCNMSLLKTEEQKIDDFVFIYTMHNIPLDEEITIRSNNLINIRKLKLDNYCFETYFDVICKNKPFVMQFFSQDIKEQILNFYLTYEIPFDMIINENGIYIRMHTEVRFKSKIFKYPLNIKEISRYYNLFKAIIEFTSKFTININNYIKFTKKT